MIDLNGAPLVLSLEIDLDVTSFALSLVQRSTGGAEPKPGDMHEGQGPRAGDAARCHGATRSAGIVLIYSYTGKPIACSYCLKAWLITSAERPRTILIRI